MTISSNKKARDRRDRRGNAKAVQAHRGPRTLIEKVPTLNINRLKFSVHASHRMLQRNIHQSTVQRLMCSSPAIETEDGKYILEDRNVRVVVSFQDPTRIVTAIDLRSNNHDSCKLPLNGKDFKAWFLCMKKIRREMFPMQDVVFTNAHTNFSCVVSKPYTNQLKNGQEIFEMATADPMFRIGLKEFQFQFESWNKKVSVDDFKVLSTRQILVNAYETYQSVNITVW